ncbi:transcription accessory protein [Fusobacterium necrophorum DAB]|uniref:Tex family protein n=2 Tax=Fusobacterium necrophorum TaxID=859 RepID=UPI000460F71D|nr:Tex family protein [Fusobacterium necrophorum]KDE69084.1 transcription accessory protein [Fusobacterium necrophorum DAB]MCF0162881.1 RNA-binding transcriptional accessory protein [Fusobacterium necrophorum]
MNNIFSKVAKELSLQENQVESTVKLLDEGATVPFISRYRKEITGNLDEVQITIILEKVQYLRNLEKRKEEVLRLIEEQGKLTEELVQAIGAAEKLQEVEDIYFPYRKKKKTKADIAMEKGLEALADFFLVAHNVEEIEGKAEEFLTEEVPNIEEAIEGATLIWAQRISEKAEYRERIREILLKYGQMGSKESRKAKELDEKGVYQDYYDYTEALSKIPSHRILAVNRGEKEGILSVSLFLEEKEKKHVDNLLLRSFSKEEALQELFVAVVHDSFDRLLFPSVEREVRNILTDKAEEDAILVFRENLKNLLLQAPLHEKTILALDPGYRTGCKVAILDKHGFYQENDVFFLVEGMHHEKQLETARKKVLHYIKKYGIDLVVIGNGTASRETESFIAKLIREENVTINYLIANEAGASVYSASKLAAEEFPDLDVTVRGAISIGRRIQDPLAELVKIDPKSIGVGMYQHDVNQGRLDESLDQVITTVVNSVGANLNTASWALLSHISGIKKSVAKNIVDYRKEHGNFTKRETLLKVKGLGPKAYEQMAGFLVIPEGENILDNTIIHPESYHIAEKMLEEIGCTLEEYDKKLAETREKLKSLKVEKFAEKYDFGLETCKDVYEALRKDRRDPRENFQKPLLKSDILNIDHLSVGMELEGTVRNVVKFGAFVDIGLKNDALLHISSISDEFVSDPSKVLSVGQIIKVRIKEIDKERGRVGLTRKKEL